MSGITNTLAWTRANLLRESREWAGCMMTDVISTAVLSGPQEHSFGDNPQEWGQGAPEVEDDIPNAFHKPTHIDISVSSREYGPTRPWQICTMFNSAPAKPSKYNYENVCIVPGGRAGLLRITAVLGNAYLSFFSSRTIRRIMRCWVCSRTLQRFRRRLTRRIRI